MQNNNICYSLDTDGVLDLEDLWSDAIDNYGTIPKGEKQEKEPNKPPQKGENETKKNRFKRTHILVAVYVAFIILELFFCVPYHKIQIFVSSQSVPHTEIVGSGYTTMLDISNDDARFRSNDYPNIGKKVNTPQLFMNVSTTTFLVVAIYFLLQKKETIEELPVLDVNALVFCTEEQIAQAEREYARKMYEYVKRKER